MTPNQWRPQARKMPRFLKMSNHLLKKKHQQSQKESLVRNMRLEPTETGDEDASLINTANQFGADIHLDSQDTILPILTDTHTEEKYIQELKFAAEQIKQCGITPDRIGGFDYITAVERFVDNNFPEVPTDSKLHIGEYLNDVMHLICNKVAGIVPVLDDSTLLNYVLDSYNRHLFDMLGFLLDKSSSVKDTFILLQWVKKTYFRQDIKGRLITGNNVLSMSDPLLLAEWLDCCRQKLLTLLRDSISTTLHNILQHTESCVCDYSNEEAIIQVQLDVIQCLNAPIQESKTISHSLKKSVQRLCCDELHSFIQKYMNEQKGDKANLLWHFKTIHTLRQLRSYALSITESNSNKDVSTLKMLKNMETQSLSSTQQYFANIAKDNLKKNFNREDGELNNMMDIIQSKLANLPQVSQGNETTQLIVKAAYHSITREYLQCLMKRKYKKLEKRWTDVEKKIMLDAELFHSTFAQQNGCDEQKIVLLKMGEILQCRNIDTLKLLCSDLYLRFPEESVEYLPALLHWRGVLSRRQIRIVIDVSREAANNIGNGDRADSCVYWCCCLC